MIANDKVGQTLSEFDNIIENIFKLVCGMNVHKGKNSFYNIRPNKTPTH